MNKNGHNMINMKKNKIRIIDIVSIIYLVVAFSVTVFMVVSLISFSCKDTILKWSCPYPGSWERIYEDGSRVPFELSNNDYDFGDKVVLESVLPSHIPDDTVFSIMVYRDTKIFIDDNQVAEFTNRYNPLPGENVKGYFIQVKLNSRHEGKKIRIEKYISENLESFDRMYYGDSLGIFAEIFRNCGVQFCMAGILFVIATIFLIISLFIIGKYEEWKMIFSISLGFMGLAMWEMVDSYLTQYVLGIYYIDGVWGYFLTMLFIVPFVYFANLQQERRYEKYAIIVEIIMLIDFVVISFLHFTNIFDFQRTRPFMNGVVAIGILFVLVTVVIDIFKGRCSEYIGVVIGMVALSVCGIIEVVLINSITDMLDGFIMLSGMYFLLIVSIANIFKNIKAKNDEAVEAVRANELKSDFLANMSHEIRTPINAIMGMNEMIIKENDNEVIEEYAKNIKHASNNLLTIINDILDISKIESGRMELVENDYSLFSVYKDVTTMMDIKAKDKNLALEKFIEESLPDKLHGDDGKLRQIMINILNNAVKYTKKGSISLNLTGEIVSKNDNSRYLNIKIEVKDTGIGIKKEDIGKLFQKFSRVDEKINKGIEGTGLGLAITKSFVDMIGGELEVESEYGVGTKFIIVLPQKIVDDITIKEEKANREKEKAAKKEIIQDSLVKFPENVRILAVDDVEMNLLVIVGFLKTTGITVDKALSGNEALEKIRDTKYDLILMDHMMPGIDGIETLRRMREDKSHINQDIPVIVLTANAIVGSEDMYEKAGFSDYLSKPIDCNLLLETLHKYIK